jgi:hypothetical protein
MMRALKILGASQETPTISDADRTGLSATTYLLLCISLGPHLAFSLIVVAAIVALWAALCRRFPAVGYFTGVFVVGFIQGLLGYRRRTRRR